MMDNAMFNQPNLPVFLVAALILLITPGPAVLYIIARSLDQGRVAGLVSVAGLSAGTWVHAFGAALGVSAILVSSALAFSVVKYLGAAYLIYLGLRRLMSRNEIRETTHFQPQRLRRIFSQGIVVAILNPKSAMFFFAFLPQFVDPAHGSVTLQLLTLGFIYIAMALITDGAYALLAGTFGGWLKGRRSFLRGERYVVGSTYIGLGVVAAFADFKNK
jgi:threonine/homoserine/homoserine lactone efflux protein